jgi:hypothetical protein
MMIVMVAAPFVAVLAIVIGFEAGYARTEIEYYKC